jgi:hypothetical protein
MRMLGFECGWMVKEEQEDKIQGLKGDHEIVGISPGMRILDENPGDQGHHLGND